MENYGRTFTLAGRSDAPSPPKSLSNTEALGRIPRRANAETGSVLSPSSVPLSQRDTRLRVDIRSFCGLWLVARGKNELYMTDLKGLRQLIKRDDGWIALTTLQIGEILLAEARARLDLFLRQASILSQASEVLPYQLAHIHAPMVGV